MSADDMMTAHSSSLRAALLTTIDPDEIDPFDRLQAASLEHWFRTDHLGHHLKKLAYKANRASVAERFPDPAVQQSSAVDLALLDTYDHLLTELELALVRLCAIHASRRFPRVQACFAYCRLVTGAKAAAGKRWGTSAPKIGHAQLTWAFSEAAVLCLRDHPLAPPYRARLEQKPDQGQALTVRAHQLARAVYDRRTRHVTFDTNPCFHRSWRGADEPGAHGPTIHVEPER